MKKTVYLFDGTGKFVERYDAQESPLEPGVFLTPVLSTEIAPPPFEDGQQALFLAGTWVIEDIPNPEPDPVPDPVPLPLAVTPWQIRKALNAVGLRASVEAAVAASDQTTKDAWQYATEFRRDNPLVNGVALALGKTEAELDAVFNLAVTL